MTLASGIPLLARLRGGGQVLQPSPLPAASPLPGPGGGHCACSFLTWAEGLLGQAWPSSWNGACCSALPPTAPQDKSLSPIRQTQDQADPQRSRKSPGNDLTPASGALGLTRRYFSVYKSVASPHRTGWGWDWLSPGIPRIPHPPTLNQARNS